MAEKHRRTRSELRSEVAYRIFAGIAWVAAAFATVAATAVVFGLFHRDRVIFLQQFDQRLPLLAVLVGIGLVLWLAHILIAVHMRVVSRAGRALVTVVEPGSATEPSTRIAADARVLLTDAIGAPRTVIPRITESLAYEGRSLRISSALTFALPEAMRGKDAVVPVLYQAHGVLADKLEVTDPHGRRISTLPRESSSALLLGIFADLANRAFPRRLRARRVEVIALAQKLISSHDQAQAQQLNLTIRSHLEAPGVRPVFAAAARVFVGRMVEVHPVLVVLTPQEGEATTVDPAPLTRRVSVSRLTPPRYGPLPSPDTSGSFVRRLRAAATFVLSVPVRARAVFMVREPVIRFSLDNADRAASYHVQIGAPDDMYVADSRARPSWILADAERPIFAQSHVIRPKDGQPVAHLYARGAAGFSDVDFVTRFRESQPGSAGEAMIGAAGIAVILMILYLADGQSELLNLIAPIVLAGVGTGSIWRGVVHSRSPFGGEMSARVSSIATVVIAILSLLSNTLQSGVGHCLANPLPPDCVGVTYEAFAALAFIASHHWLLLVAAAANAVFIFISWFINVHAELSLVNKGERRRWRS